jgi:hypothetical protein
MPHGFSDLQQWLRVSENAAPTPPSDDHQTAATLLDMGGGKHWVKEDKYNDFLEVYARCIDEQVRKHDRKKTNLRGISFAECRGEIFRFFVDFDIPARAPWEDEQYALLASTSIGVVRRFIDPTADDVDAYLGLVMATTEPKPKEDGTVKIGVHITFDGLVVDKEMALRMREMLIVDFSRDFGELLDHPTPDKVRDIIDASVYRQTASGLRMLGSVKTERCFSCSSRGAEERKVCTFCYDDHTGRRSGKNFLYKRIYTVHGIFGADGSRDCRDDVVKMYGESGLSNRETMKRASIRAPKGAVKCPYWRAPEGCPPLLPGGRARRDTMTEMPVDRDRTNKMFRGREVLHNSDARVSAMTSAVRDLHPKWCEVEARECFYLPASGMYIYKGHGMGAYWCRNKGDYHTNSSVYWCFEPRAGGKVHQRCFSMKEVPPGRSSCTCGLYRGSQSGLTKDAVTLLWPKSILVQPMLLQDGKRKRIADRL